MCFMQTYWVSDETTLFRKIVDTLYLLILICIQIHQESKVQLFCEGHKNLRNLPYGFDIYFSKRQNHI